MEEKIANEDAFNLKQPIFMTVKGEPFDESEKGYPEHDAHDEMFLNQNNAEINEQPLDIEKWLPQIRDKLGVPHFSDVSNWESVEKGTPELEVEETASFPKQGKIQKWERTIGRRPYEFVRKYFAYDCVGDLSTCRINNCGTILKGRHSTNLQKHVRRQHAAEASEMMQERMRIHERRLKNKVSRHLTQSSPSVSTSTDTSSVSTPSSSRSTTIRCSKSAVIVEMDKQSLLNAFLELTTVNGHPFSIVEDSGMRRIIDPLIAAIHSQTGEQVIIDRENLQTFIHQEAGLMRQLIQEEIKNKMISLKLDSVSLLGRSVLAVNIQFCHKGDIVQRNLCLQELFQHTSLNLKEIIQEILMTYGTSLKQVYCIVIDNLRNMMKAECLLKENFLEDVFPFIEMYGDEGTNFEKLVSSTEEETLGRMEWLRLHPDLLTEIKSEGILEQQCASHKLQLAVQDGLAATSDANCLIEKGRSLVKALRTPSGSHHLIQLGYRRPFLDSKACWISTVDMIDSLLNLKDICFEVLTGASTENLAENEWADLRGVSAALHPARIATKQFQKELMNVGDFIAVWMRCKFDTKKIESSLAFNVFHAMETRERELFESSIVSSALCLDPRYHVLLKDENLKRAEDDLVTLWNRILVLSSQDISDFSAVNSVIQPPLENHADPLKAMLCQMQKRRQANREKKGKNIRRIIQEFIESVPVLPENENVFLYWEAHRLSDPELYKLATTVLAVPVTQVSAGRTYSHLQFILNSLQNNMPRMLTSDILFIHCNKVLEKL